MTDQNSQFFAILTAIGEAKQANAAALGTSWTFAQMGVGDANGTEPIPDRLQTRLINERRRAPLNQVKVDPNNASVIIAEQIIPESDGGWWVREIALYDAAGDMVAVANCAPTFKPLLSQGSGRTQIIRMNLIVSSQANIVLKIDPSVVLATREYVDLSIESVLPANKVAGTYQKVTIDKRGVVISGENPTTLAGHGITDTYRAVDIDDKLNGKVRGDWADTIGFAADNPAQPYVRQTSTGTNFLLAPANHSHSFSSLTGIPTTLAGHGIYDAFTKTQVEALLDGRVAQLINAAPGALDTIGELATALNNNPNFATDVINGLAGKANKGTSLKDYGILDSYRAVDVDWRLDAKANWGTSLADYRITDSYRAIDVDYKLVFKADRASTAAGYGLTDVHTLTSFMKPVTGQWVGLSGVGVIPAGGTWAYFVVSYNNVGTIVQSGAGVTTGGTTVGFTTSSNGFAWRVE